MHLLHNMHMVSMQQKTLTETNDLSYSQTDLLNLHPNIFCSFTVTPSFHIQLLEALNISVNAEKSTSTTSHFDGTFKDSSVLHYGHLLNTSCKSDYL